MAAITIASAQQRVKRNLGCLIDNARRWRPTCHRDPRKQRHEGDRPFELLVEHKAI
jgi:hypothetical protein